MRRLMFTLALLATLAVGTAAALEVNGIRQMSATARQGCIASAGFITTEGHKDPQALPDGIIMWTGDGSDFWFEFQVAHTQQFASLETAGVIAQRVPGYLLIPVSAYYDSLTGADKLYFKGVYVNSPTDSLFYRWVDE